MRAGCHHQSSKKTFTTRFEIRTQKQLTIEIIKVNKNDKDIEKESIPRISTIDKTKI